MHETIVIYDFGSQYTQLIARRIREMIVYCQITPWNKMTDAIQAKGVILSGSPYSVRMENAPNPNTSSLRDKFPLLGICYGAQLLAQQNGGNVEASNAREYGRAQFSPQIDDPFLKGVSSPSQVWMSHGDSITNLPEGALCLGSTQDVTYAAFRFRDEATYGVQFHPEVYHSEQGDAILRNFVLEICGCQGDWTPGLS